MLIVGELINTSRKNIEPAVASRDEAFLRDIAKKQVEAGAAYVDVNAGTFVDAEVELLPWLVQIVQAETGSSCSVDSANPRAIEAALAVHKGKAMVNSITAEDSRYNNIVPLVVKYGCAVVALCMDGRGIPETARARAEIAERLVQRLTNDGVPRDNIYLDPLVQPISTGSHNGVVVLDTIRFITQDLGVNSICGLSNVSYGLPLRPLINRSFLVLAMGAGLNAAIINPLDKKLMALLRASEALLNRDPHCRAYLTAFRKGELDLEK
ncbi:MAG: methyltetrahydrofolate cobalamin methyltransferase [Firmicutes bacterium]|nr:methyltetrahydrofolate cobalamin methyltransferase [Bacillota bacterium]